MRRRQTNSDEFPVAGRLDFVANFSNPHHHLPLLPSVNRPRHQSQSQSLASSPSRITLPSPPPLPRLRRHPRRPLPLPKTEAGRRRRRVATRSSRPEPRLVQAALQDEGRHLRVALQPPRAPPRLPRPGRLAAKPPRRRPPRDRPLPPRHRRRPRGDLSPLRRLRLRLPILRQAALPRPLHELPLLGRLPLRRRVGLRVDSVRNPHLPPQLLRRRELHPLRNRNRNRNRHPPESQREHRRPNRGRFLIKNPQHRRRIPRRQERFRDPKIVESLQRYRKRQNLEL